MKTFEFKDNKYELTSLIKHHYDESLVDFKRGEVKDLSTGELFPIGEMFKIYKDNINNLLQNGRNFSSSSEMSKVKKIYENQIKGIKVAEFQSKLKNDEITLEEIEEWVELMNYKDRSDFGVAKYTSYITINHAKPKPEGLNRNDYSRFFELIYIMNYRNQVSYSNGKPIKRDNLAELLEFSSLSGLDKFINKLKKFNMLIRTEPNNKNVSFLMINPAYAMRQIEIDLTTYNYFKDDLDDLLTPLEKKYIELKGNIKQANHILSIDNS